MRQAVLLRPRLFRFGPTCVGLLFVLVLCLSWSSALWPNKISAATSTTVNFQARLMNSSGSIAPDGDYNIEFKLYDTASTGGTAQGACSGNCKWIETRTGANKVHVENGYVTVALGQVNPFGASINWDQDLWVTMNIGSTGTPSWDGEMSPRLKLTAVPYAFRAAQLSRLGGFTGTLELASSFGRDTLITLPDPGVATATVCYQSAASCGFVLGTATNFIQTVPTGTANTIQPTAAGVVALTVNGTSNASGATALAVVQSQANDAVSVAVTGSSQTNGILVNRTNAGTLTNGIQITNTSGTVSYGLSFSGTIGTDINRSSGVLSLQGTGGVTVTAGGTTTLGLDTAGAGTVNLGNANATTIALGGAAGASTTIAGGNVAHSVAIATGGTSTTQSVTIGSTGSASATRLQAGTGNIVFDTGGTVRGTFDSANGLYLGNGLTAAAPNNFTVAGTGSTTAGTAGANLTLQAGAGASTTTGSAGGNLLLAGGNAAGTGNNTGGIITLQAGLNTNTGAAGKVLVKNSANSATAFQVQNAAGTSTVLDVDTTNGRLGVGTAAPARTLDIAVNSTSIDTPSVRLYQSGAGDATLELGSAGTANSIFLGLDSSNAGGFTIGSSTAASNFSTPAMVQSVGSLDGSGTTVPSVTQPVTATGAGNLIVAAISWDTNNGAVTTMTCSDTINTYTNLALYEDTANHQALQLCYAAGTLGGTTAVTATFGGSNARYLKMTVSEFSGIAAVSPVDASTGQYVASASTSADAATSGLATTTLNGDLIFGAIVNTTDSSGISTGSGFTQELILPASGSNNKEIAAEHRIQATPGSTSATFTFNQTDSYVAAMAAFKPASTGMTDTFSNALFTLSQTGAVRLKGSANSATAFQVQNAVGTNFIGVDTVSNGLNLGITGAVATAGTVNIATTTGAAQSVVIGSASANASSTVIQGGNTNTAGSEAIRLTPNAAGGILIGAATGTGTITVGKSTATNIVSIGSGDPAASATQTINIGNGSQSTLSSGIVVNILSGAAGTNGTATLNLGNNDRVTAINIGNVAADANRTITIGGGNTPVGVTDTINIGTGTPAGSNVVTIGSTASSSATTLQAGTGNLTLNTGGTARAVFDTAGSLYLGNGLSAAAPSGFAVRGTASTTTAVAGGALTLQGGNATVGNANGGSVTITGGTGFGTGVRGLVVIDTPTFTTASTQSCGSNCTATQANVDNSGAVVINATAASLIVTLPDPTITTAGRIVYVTAANGSSDFTLSVNGGGTGNQIAMRQNTTATMIWNGSDWTAAGASSSTTLQAAYDNTLSSAGGAEIVLNNTATSDGLTVRNSASNPIIGAILEAQTSIGSNLFSVNNNATEYASNGGAETAGASSSTFPSTTWSAAPAGGTVSRNTTAANNATGQASVSVVTTATAGHGARDRLTSALTANLQYTVSFTVRGATSFTTLNTVYSRDGTDTATTACATGSTVTTAIWTRISCTFTAPATGITSSNEVFIRQSDATARTFYIDNLSVTVNASANHVADGSVDVALGANWTAYDADGGAGTTTLARETTVIYDTSGSVSDITTAAANEGMRNNLTITPRVSTQYLVTFYARSSNTFNDITVGFLPAGGSSAPVAAQLCTDYNTQSVSTSGWTKVTCIITTPASGITDPDLVIYQPTATARTFYVDALSMTLNTNTASNVQVGGGNKGGPATLLTLDRSAGAPIADNNDAYLGSMYYDTSSGRIQCYEADGWGACGAAPDNIVNLNPEYAGAVLNGSGIGTMSADFCSNDTALSINSTLCSTGQAKNFYKWTSPQATQQTYSIYVTYQLPATFKNFASDDTVQLVARTDSTSNAAITYEMFKSDGSTVTKCGTGETTVVTSANSWQSVGINGNESTSCNFSSSSAGNFVIFKINLKANSNANAYVSTLSFTTTGR